MFAVKGDLMALLDELGAPVANLQIAQSDPRPWWRPGRAARLQLGAKAVLAEFGELHPKVLGRAGRRGADLRVRGLDRGDPGAEEEGGEDQAGAGALAADAAAAATSPSWWTATRAAGDIVRAVQSADRR